MNPFYLEIVGALLRAGMTFLSGWLVSRHILSADQADHLTTDLVTHAMFVAPAILALAWSIARKLKRRVAERAAAAGLAIVLLVCVAGASTACAAATAVRPPVGTYTPPVQQAWDAGEGLKALNALAQTAKNLNAQHGRLHLTDLDTAYILDSTIVLGAFLSAYGQGATTLTAIGRALDTLQLPPGVLRAARGALERALTRYGDGGPVVALLRDAYGLFLSGLSIDASQHPELVAVLNGVAIALQNVPELRP